MTSRVYVAAVAVFCATAVLDGVCTADNKQFGNMGFKKERKRQIIYNDDGDQQFKQVTTRYGVTDEQSFIDARTTPTFDTQVDTYVWCVGNGSWPPWGPRSGPLMRFVARPGEPQTSS